MTWLVRCGSDAPDVVLPPFAGAFESVAVSAPFVFEGHVAGFGRDPEVELFQVNLDGRGTVTLNLSHNSLDQATYTQPFVTYTFGALAPTPEPTAFILFGTGLAGVLLRRRLRRRTTI
jgi:hypothetical protein